MLQRVGDAHVEGVVGAEQDGDNFVVEYTALERTGVRRPVGAARPGEDLFALWNRTPPESGLWVPAPV